MGRLGSGKCHRVNDFELGLKDEWQIARQSKRDGSSRQKEQHMQRHGVGKGQQVESSASVLRRIARSKS